MKLAPFKPSVSYTNGCLSIGIPGKPIHDAVRRELGSYVGRHHDTEFNLVDVWGLDFQLLNDGCSIKGDWRVQHRERIFRNPFSGGMMYTPWVSMSGYFRQDFHLSINSGILNVQATSNHISTSQWYQLLLDTLVRWFGVNGRLQNAVNAGLSDFHQHNISRTLLEFKGEIASKTGLTVQQVERILSSTGSLNARPTPDSLNISILVPRNVL